MKNNYYNKIKERLINVEVFNKVKDYSKNKYQIENYFEIGKLLIEAQGGEARAKYGDNLIKEYSIKLTKEIDKKYNTTLLKRIRQFYLLILKGATLSHQLPWSNYVELLPLNDINKINYYISICKNNSLTVRELRDKIKTKEYERLPQSTKKKLITKEEVNLIDTIKEPIVINNTLDKEIISEKALHQLILDNITSFLKELGNGFTYVDSEYKIKLGNTFNYIDLLLFNYEYNSFVVVELKTTELKKEHIGQILTYVGHIDEYVKKESMNSTIGIIICKENNKYIIKYSTNPNIISREYILN